LESRARKNEKINFIWNSVVIEIGGTDAVEYVKIKNVVNENLSEFRTDGVFVFIGHTPNTDMFKDQVALDSKSYIIVDQRMQTNIKGVFAAGEVCDPHYRQVITSAGMGAAAAIEATRLLESEE